MTRQTCRGHSCHDAGRRLVTARSNLPARRDSCNPPLAQDLGATRARRPPLVRSGSGVRRLGGGTLRDERGSRVMGNARGLYDRYHGATLDWHYRAPLLNSST